MTAPKPPRHNSAAATAPITVMPNRWRGPTCLPSVRAAAASASEMTWVSGARRTSSRQPASTDATGSVGDIRAPAASASSRRSLRATASNPDSYSGIVATCLDDLCPQPGQRAMLGHPDRTGRAADGISGLLGAQPDDHPQNQDFALLGGQQVQQRVHSHSGVRLDGHLLWPDVGRGPLGDLIGGLGTV